MTDSAEDSDLFKTLFGLVEHYSPSGQEAGAVEFLVGRMQELGFTNSLIDPAGNAVGVMGAGDKQIVLLGHIDTVPGEIPVRVEGDLLYGRGTTDAKGPLANFVEAAATLDLPPDWQVVVIGAVDEERDSRGARYVRDQYRPTYVIVGEPSRWNRITLGYKGVHAAALTVREKVRHGAAQEPTASEQAVELWNAIQAWCTTHNEGKEAVFDQVTARLLGIRNSTDGYEEWARLEIQTRLPLDLEPEAWQASLETLAGGAEIARKGFPVPAYLGEKNNAVVRAFLSSIRASGGQPGFVVKSGTADMNVVGPAWNCPMAAYGPGDSRVDHTPDEHISLSEYSRAVKVLKIALARLTGRV